MRAEGKKFREIAVACGYSDKASAFRAIQAAMRVKPVDIDSSIEAVRQEMVESLYMQIEALWSAAMAGDTKANDTLLRVYSRMSSLLGLDAPVRQEVTGKDGGPLAIDDARAVLAETIARVAGKPNE